MIIYFILAVVILLIQLLVLLEGYRHCLYTRRKYRPKPSKYQPTAAVICPCKGLDTTFDRNINSLFVQDYPHYEIYFVVQSDDDPAYFRLRQIMQQHQNANHPVRTHLIVAGPARSCVQKVHNLLTACQALPDHVKVMAFIDSDACLKPHFVGSLIHPLRRREVGAATGYRWFVPTDNRLSSKVLSVMNASVASLLGPHQWNSAWGGAMAIRRDIFDKVGVTQAWQNACSDDYLLTDRIKKNNLTVYFVPACFVASYEQMSWRQLFSFARRQFVLTKVCNPQFLQHSRLAPYVAILPAALMSASMAKALARQFFIRKILPEDRKKLLAPALLDIFLGPVIAVFSLGCVLSAAGSRTIVWRGIKYHLKDINHTQILDSRTGPKSN